METKSGKEQNHIENIDRGDLSLLILPNVLEEHKRRYELVVEILKGLNDSDNKKPTIIDMASARGLGTEILATELPEAKVIGLEIGWQYVKRAAEKKKKAKTKPNYVQADVLRAPLANDCADAIAMFEIMEHLPKSEQGNLLKEAFRLLKKGGVAMVSIPYPYSFDNGGNRTGASSNPYHQYEPSVDEVISLIKQSGFKMIDRFGQSEATELGINLAKKFEKSLRVFHIPAWTIYSLNMNFLRNPVPFKIENDMKQKIPLTQIFLMRK